MKKLIPCLIIKNQIKRKLNFRNSKIECWPYKIEVNGDDYEAYVIVKSNMTFKFTKAKTIVKAGK